MTGVVGDPSGADLDQALVALMAELLEQPQLGPEDSFFKLGGHSLLGTKLVSRVRARMGLAAEIRDLFENPTPVALAARLRIRNGLSTPLRQVPRPQRIPLSYAQQRLWFLAELDRSSANYNVPIAVRLHGRLDTSALRAALGDVVAKHESLRTIVDVTAEGPAQRILPSEQVPLPVHDIAVSDPETVSVVVQDFAERPFDLGRDIPVRCQLVRIDQQRHVLILVLHHIAADGWSLAPLFADLATAYRQRRAGSDSGLPPLPVHYADYALWQRQYLGDASDPGSRIAGQAEFWRGQLAGVPEETELPRDRPRRSASSAPSRSVQVSSGPDLRDRLARLADEHSVTQFMVMHAALAAHLGRYEAGRDIVIGSPIAGRREEALSDLVGFFVNTLPIRTRLGGDPTFTQLLARVRSDVLDAYDNQDVPFEHLVGLLNPVRDRSRHPVFQVLLAVQNNAPVVVELDGLDSSMESVAVGTAKFDLAFFMIERPAGLEVVLEYAPELFDERTTDRLARGFLDLLAAAADRPDRSVSELTAPTPAAVEEVLRLGTGPAVDLCSALAPDLLDAAAARYPDEVAVRTVDQALTYRRLHVRAQQLARVLIGHGIGPEAVVAIGLPASADLVVAILAVLKTGAGYLPVDPNQPSARIGSILLEAAPGAVITGAGGIEAPVGPAVVDLTAPSTVAALDREDGGPIGAGERTGVLRPETIVYVVYTSGSTGRPKGIAMPQQGLTNLLRWHCTSFLPGGPGTITALNSAVGFDLCIEEVLGTLAAGKTLAIPPPEVRADPRSLVSWLTEFEVNELFTTRSGLDLITEAAVERGLQLPDLMHIVQAGEQLRVSAALERFLNTSPSVGRCLHNEYGPAEVHAATWHPVRGQPVAAGSTVPIGLPLSNVRVYVLGEDQRLLPPGVRGQLCVGGAQVARGYFGRPEMTAERFLPDPFGPPGSRMYSTGDLVRWNADGDLECFGRTDDQVKIRGFRVEPQEVETVLAAHPAVAVAAVAVRTDHQGEPALAAWAALHPGTHATAADLRQHLRDRLPSYLVPALQLVGDLPLSPNGKADRSRLPAGLPVVESGARPPATEDERVVAGIYAELLGVDTVDADADFFDLGGHSLLATKLIGRLRETFRVELSLSTAFDHPTVTTMAAAIGSAPRVRPIVRMDRPERVPLSFPQQRLWFLSQLEGASPAYTIALAFRLVGELDVAALRSALVDLVERHSALRTVIATAEGVPYQVVQDPPDVTDVLSEFEGAKDEALRAEARRSFDLGTELPVRFGLFRAGPQDSRLLLTVHHICVDGWSLRPLLADLQAAYAARVDDRRPTWESLPVDYLDYTLWQRQTFAAVDSGPLADQIEFWRQELSGLPVPADVLLDRRRPRTRRYRGQQLAFDVTAEQHVGLLALAQEHRVTLFMALHGLLAVLLSRSGAGRDVAVGAAISGRHDPALKDMVGFFVNSLVLRTRLGRADTFTDVLAQVGERDRAAYAHQDVPFEKLVELLEPPRNGSATPFFGTSLVLQHENWGRLDLPGLAVSPIPLGIPAARFDLTWSVAERHGADGAPAGMRAFVEYDTDLYDRATVQTLVDRFNRLLTAALANPGSRIGDVPLTAPEADPVPLEPVGSGETVVDLIDAGLRGAGDRTVLVCGPERRTARELDGDANQLARFLIRLGVGPERTVAVAMERSTTLVTTAVAVLRAGGAYLPLNTDEPAERAGAVLTQGRPVLLITGSDVPWAGSWSGRRVSLDDLGVRDRVVRESRAPINAADRLGAMSDGQVVVVTYTSGSTGAAKGVLSTHRGLVARLLALSARLRVTGADRHLLKTPISFDVSLSELLLPLVTGGTVVVAEAGAHRDPARLRTLLAEEDVTVVHFLPTMLRALLDSGDEPALPALRMVICGGETLGADVVQAAREQLPAAEVWNCYGPAEASIDVTAGRCSDADGGPPTIGPPLADAQVLLLDDWCAEVGTHAPGEIHLGGDHLARGYLGDPLGTAERFLPNPYGPPGSRMYRTGDLGRRLRTGELLHLGRSDDQVKIRGSRVEPAEVEAVLERHPAVRQALVVSVPGPGGAALVAYLRMRTEDTASASADAVRRWTADRVPGFLVPSRWVLVEDFPLLSSGKIDRRALPPPGPVASGARPPGTAQEQQVASLFADLLGVPEVEVDADADFFALGGHSLLAARLQGRLRTVFGRVVPLEVIIEESTVDAIARAVANGGALGGRRPGRPAALRRLRRGAGAPVFLLPPVLGLPWCYTGLARRIDAPVYGIVTAGPDFATATFANLAAECLDEIRTVQPAGPYRLLGWSLGGVLAHAVAEHAEQRGFEVALLGLFDSFPPGVGGARPARPDDLYATVLRAIDPRPAIRPVRSRADLIDGIAAAADLVGPGAEHGADELADAAIRNLQLAQAHRPGVVRADVRFFRAGVRPAGADLVAPAVAWRPYLAGSFEEHLVPAGHHQLMSDPVVLEIAASELNGLLHSRRVPSS